MKARLLLGLFAAILLSIVPATFAQVSTGMPPFSSVTGGPDLINPGNLNVHWDFPFYHRAGRGLAFSYVMSYDSSIWNPVTVGSTTSWQPVTNFGWRGQSEAMTGYIHFSDINPAMPGPQQSRRDFQLVFLPDVHF